MDAASIEQMNKVRVSLGMAPLPVPGKDVGPQFKQSDESESEEDMSTLDKRQAAADRNWQKLEGERREKAEREKRKAAAKKARDAAARYAKMEGKGLGDADEEEELDTRSWLLGHKMRQKQIEKARKLEEELAEREGLAEQQQYTSKDLAGVKVGHEAAAFDETKGEQVLTLKDTAIGEDSEDDELESADLRAKEKLEERLKLKKKRPDYDPTEQGEAQGVLSKYDEEIDGKKVKRFTLDGQGNTVEGTQKNFDAEGEIKRKGVKISLDMFKNDAPVSDYVDPSTIKVRKPKKKKDKKVRQKAADEDDIFAPTTSASAPQPDGNKIEVDGAHTHGSSNSRKRTYDAEDDEDLQAKLAEQRRQALKKRKRMDAAELARQMREEMPVDDEGPEEVGMIMDETTEFVANLRKPEAPENRDRTSRTPQPATAASPDPDDAEDGGDTRMQSYAEAADEEERQERAKRETSAGPNVTTTGLEEEDTLSGTGTAAALALLRKRGLIAEGGSAELAERERQRAKFLADKQHLIDEYDQQAREQRERDRRSGRFDRMSNRERDAYARSQNEQREAYIAKLLADKFSREYRPNVKLEYHDEYGRSMNQKEAFKHLSHMFHGKGSGKQKTEKRLKKIEDEKRGAAKGVLHAEGEGGFMDVQGREGRKQKQAGVRLQ